MIAARRARIFEQLYPDGDGALQADHLGLVCASVTATTGAGLMLMSDDLPRGVLATTDEVSALIEELQFSLGEGPGIDAFRQDHPVQEPDLAAPSALRWPMFAPAAVEAGARAVFGFPLRVGGVRLGALNLYCDSPRTLSAGQSADALVMADVAAELVLLMYAGSEDESAGEVVSAGDLHHVVHQASGMVAAQASLGLKDAFARLQAYAFANDRTLLDVGRDVVARRLRFEGEAG